MPIMRPNYDKFHRCPAATGPGMRGLPATPHCDGGTLPDSVYDRRFADFRTNRCPKCKTVVLPFAIRYLDPSNWKAVIRQRMRTQLSDFNSWVQWDRLRGGR